MKVRCIINNLICAYITVSARLDGEGIIGGTNAKPGQIKYQISLETEHDNVCGGGILDDRHVLTAAHCVTTVDGSFRNEVLMVLAGAIKANINVEKSPHAVRIDVEKIFIPRKYSALNLKFGEPYRPVGDIAVLRLKDSLGLKDNPLLSKLDLPEPYNNRSYPSYVGEEVVIAGYGYNWIYMSEDPRTHKKFEAGGASTDKLRFAEATVVDNDKCDSLVKDPIYTSHLCAMVNQQSPSNPEGVCSVSLSFDMNFSLQKITFISLFMDFYAS